MTCGGERRYVSDIVSAWDRLLSGVGVYRVMNIMETQARWYYNPCGLFWPLENQNKLYLMCTGPCRKIGKNREVNRNIIYLFVISFS